MAGNAAICEGWSATAEERMACCTEGSDCPMHKRESHHAASTHPLTQGEADACCAASERDESSSSRPAFVPVISVAVLGSGITLPASVPALVLTDDWRT